MQVILVTTSKKVKKKMNFQDGLGYSVMEFFRDIPKFFYNLFAKGEVVVSYKAIIGGKEYPNLIPAPDHVGWNLFIGKYKIFVPERRIHYDRDYTVALMYVLDHVNNYNRLYDVQLLRASIIEIADNNLNAVEITEHLLNEIQEEQRRKGN